jgi:hypothetical protein
MCDSCKGWFCLQHMLTLLPYVNCSHLSRMLSGSPDGAVPAMLGRLVVGCRYWVWQGVVRCGKCTWVVVWVCV